MIPLNGRRITKFIDEIVWHVQFKGDTLLRVLVNQTATDGIFFIMWAVQDARATAFAYGLVFLFELSNRVCLAA